MHAGRFAIMLMTLAIVSPQPGETLRQILQQNAIPISGFTPAELDAQVSSGAVSSKDDKVLLAYPTRTGEQTIGAPMHVVVYDRSTQKLVHRAIAAEETSDGCFRSASISEQGGYILLATHINPSADCTLVLDPNLRVRHTLFGWVVAQLGPHGILLEENEMHFAPSHPLRLEVSDLATGRTQEVYPPDGDSLRAHFSRDLKQHLPPDAWCQEHNHHCDPSLFNEGLGESVPSNAAGAKFAFVARYDALGFGEEADHAIGTRSVLYVYRRRAEGWTYCQEELSDDEVQSRQQHLKSDFEEATGPCAQEITVKVKPVDFPFSHRNQ